MLKATLMSLHRLTLWFNTVSRASLAPALLASPFCGILSQLPAMASSVPAEAGVLPPGNATHFPAWMASAAKPHRWHQAVGKVAAVGGGLIVHSERIADR